MEKSVSWIDDEITRPLIIRLQQNACVETREFLRPIFRWTKVGNKQYNVEKAFLFADWMVDLYSHGDVYLKIPCQRQIQPKYAFNTIVTMSQRSGLMQNAERAYEKMIEYGYEPDVFTMTALLDLVGRYGSLEKALLLYSKMLNSKNTLPNIVSFITLIRIAGNHQDSKYGSFVVNRLHQDAKLLVSQGLSNSLLGNNHQLEGSLYNTILAACVHLSDKDTALNILNEMCEYDHSMLTSFTLEIIAKLVIKLDTLSTDNNNSYINTLSETNILNKDEIQIINDQITIRKEGTLPAVKTYPGCLGPDASQNMRYSVMKHDVHKLLDRLGNSGSKSSRDKKLINDGEEVVEVDVVVGDDVIEISTPQSLVENDFTTLIHQCRKRKWGDQIAYILEMMSTLAVAGFPEKGIPSLPSVAPSLLTYEAAFDGYFNAAMGEAAWNLYLQLLSNIEIVMEMSVIQLLVKGFLYCGLPDYAIAVYRNMRSQGLVPDRKFVTGLMCGLGKNINHALYVLADACSLSDDRTGCQMSCQLHSLPPFTMTVQQSFLNTLLESCAILGQPNNIDCIINTIQNNSHLPTLTTNSEMNNLHEEYSSLHQVFNVLKSVVKLPHFDFTIALLMGACAYNDPSIAHQKLMQWQEQGILPPFPFLHLLIIEATSPGPSTTSQVQLAATLTTLPFSGFLRTGAVKYLDYRRPLVRRLYRLYNNIIPSLYPLHSFYNVEVKDKRFQSTDEFETQENHQEKNTDRIKRSNTIGTANISIDSLNKLTEGVADEAEVEVDLYEDDYRNEVFEGNETDGKPSWALSSNTTITTATTAISDLTLVSYSLPLPPPPSIPVTSSHPRSSSSTSSTIRESSQRQQDFEAICIPSNVNNLNFQLSDTLRVILLRLLCIGSNNNNNSGNNMASSEDRDNQNGDVYSPSDTTSILSPPLENEMGDNYDRKMCDSHNNNNNNLTSNEFGKHHQQQQVNDIPVFEFGLLEYYVQFAMADSLLGIAMENTSLIASDSDPRLDNHFSHHNNNGNIKRQLAAVLFLLHIHSIMQTLRTKEEKVKLSKMCQQSIQSQTKYDSQLWYLLGFICECLRAIRVLQLSARQQAKLISFILSSLSLNFTKNDSSTCKINGILQDASNNTMIVGYEKEICTFQSVLVDVVVTCGSSLDVLRELHKSFGIMSNNNTTTTPPNNSSDNLRSRLSNYLIDLLAGVTERPIKVIQFIKQYQLCDDLESASKLESLLVQLVLQDTMHWNALLLQLKDSPSTIDQFIAMIQLFIHHEKIEIQELGIKLICKLSLSDHPLFQSLMFPVSTSISLSEDINDIGDTENNQNGYSILNKTSTGILINYLKLPIPSEDIIMVDCLLKLQQARDILLFPTTTISPPSQQPSSEPRNNEPVDVIGIDVEWRPYSTGSSSSSNNNTRNIDGTYRKCGHNKCSLIQIATRSHIFLFDLMVLEQWNNNNNNNSNITTTCSKDDEDLIKTTAITVSQNDTNTSLYEMYTELMTDLLTNRKILKIGFGLSTDLGRLRESYPTSICYNNVGPILDLQNPIIFNNTNNTTSHHKDTNTNIVTNVKSKSLSSLAMLYLSQPLDKRMQRSDWQRRPLLIEQIEYAALDAFVLVCIFDKLVLDSRKYDSLITFSGQKSV